MQANGISEPRREAALLLAFVLQKDKTYLVAHPEYELTDEEENRFQEFLARRAQHEPFQYICGQQEFYGLDFTLTPDVLIPRPETELIVEAVIKILREREESKICEVGIGSGCIAVSILHEVKKATAIGLDISREALKIAKLNAEKHRVSDRIQLKVSDVFARLRNEKFDLIVSNPPYVPSEDFSTLQAEVRDYEPFVALTDGKNGLSIIEKIIVESPRFLKPEGFLLMEIGFNQSVKVREMFSPKIWQTLEFFPDLQGIPRMLRVKIADSD